MKIVGCDLHARQQSIAMVDTESGELTEKIVRHEGNAVREFLEPQDIFYHPNFGHLGRKESFSTDTPAYNTLVESW